MKHFSTLHLFALLLVAGATVTVACMEDPPPAVESLNVADYHMEEADGADAQKASLLDDIGSATERIDIAVSTLADEELAAALVDAHEAGVEVRVVGDWDAREEAGFALLDDNDIMPVFGDGTLAYLPEPTLSSIVQQCRERSDEQLIQCSSGQPGAGNAMMVRPGDYNQMAHDFAVIDDKLVWTFPPPDNTKRSWVGWRIESSQLAYDFVREFQQMHGGVFSTTLTVYNGPLKSTADSHSHYLTDMGMMRVWFNPQQRLIKTVIDEVYKAKASVWVMSDNIVNSDLIDALEYKAGNGFDVRVMTHPDHQAQDSSADRLDDLGARYAPEELDHLPTLIVIDDRVDRNGRERPRKVLSLSHPLIRAQPFDVEYRRSADQVNIFPSDLFVDGNLWELLETGTTTHQDPTIEDFKENWLQIYDSAE
ncbi:MAG: phospholipase D-like domain-containing protein [Persicimonas sp.]